MTPPTTPAIETLKSRVFEIDPGISSQYGRQRRDLKSSFHQPTGAYLPKQVRDQQMRSGTERAGRDEAEAMRRGQFDVNQQTYGRDLAVAGLTAPQLVNEGSSGTQSGQQQGLIDQSQAWGPVVAQTAASSL